MLAWFAAANFAVCIMFINMLVKSLHNVLSYDKNINAQNLQHCANHLSQKKQFDKFLVPPSGYVMAVIVPCFSPFSFEGAFKRSPEIPRSPKIPKDPPGIPRDP